MNVLVVSGDIGGARAVLPVLDEFKNKQIKFQIIAHRYLNDILPEEFSRIQLTETVSDADLKQIFNRNKIDVLLFTTSVSDVFPLKVARAAYEEGVPTVCLLDNWMNYRKRLEINEGDIFYPDIYAVMDGLAYNQAKNDGIPEKILRIVGQPVLASLEDEYIGSYSSKMREEIIASNGLDPNKKIIVFISEPVENDQGCDTSSLSYRGYTEKTVLRDFCKYINKYESEVQVVIVPHPREDEIILQKTWEECRGKLSGKLLKLERGRDAVFISNAVAGMASILLYEAWLIGKPVISLQPDLRNEQLAFMKEKEGAFILLNDSEWDYKIDDWMRTVPEFVEFNNVNSEFIIHKNASEKICELILNIK